MLKIIRFDYFPTCNLALFMKYVTISILQVFVFKIFSFGDLHLKNPHQLFDSTKHKLEETVKVTDKPPPFVTLFLCSNEYITLPSFIKPKAATTRH